MQQTFAIIGAGHAGTAAAAAMRSNGFAGRIVLIGDDPHLPYERPPLSKEALLTQDAVAPSIYPPEFYADHRIELRLGQAVLGVDPAGQSVTLADGTQIAFDKLLIATGARARRYPLLDALGAHVLRSADDAARLRPALQPGRRLLVVGGGVIGLEVAATASRLGLSVTVLERAPRLLSRGTPQPLAQILLDAHAAHGVAVHTGVDLARAEVISDGIALTAADGRSFAGDVVVYGIGVTLNDDLARGIGLAIDDGVLVDALGRTSHPAIYAAGDLARQHLAFLGRPVRQETWANALHQGAGVGRAMVTGEAVGEDIPWFWTDQFGVNYQVAGQVEAEAWIPRLGPGDRQILFGLTKGVLTGAVAVNAGSDMRLARKMILQGFTPDPTLLADPSVPMKTIRMKSEAGPGLVAAPSGHVAPAGERPMIKAASHFHSEHSKLDQPERRTS